MENISDDHAVAWYRDSGRGGGLSLFPSMTIGKRFEVRDFLGRGGCGCIVQARDMQTGRDVALKIYSGNMDKRGGLELFRHEFEILRQNRDGGHIPMLPHVYGDMMSYGTNLRPCFAMELLESFDENEIAEIAEADLDRWVEDFMLKMCDTVRALHGHRIFHRDIKLDNIMARKTVRDGVKEFEPILVDFGIAYDVQDKDILANYLDCTGTPGDAACEQFGGQEQFDKLEVAVAIDIYALGNLIEDCLGARVAISEEMRGKRISSRNARMNPPIPPHWLYVESVCRARKWWDRYPSVEALREAILHRRERCEDWIRRNGIAE